MCPQQLLGELLLNRANVQIMMRYVADVNNLMLMMNLLKDSSRSIQYEAFHVFKVLGVEVIDTPHILKQVFVANPKKPKTIINILAVNKEKLVKYLSDFHTDRGAVLLVVLLCATVCPQMMSSFVMRRRSSSRRFRSCSSSHDTVDPLELRGRGCQLLCPLVFLSILCFSIDIVTILMSLPHAAHASRLATRWLQ